MGGEPLSVALAFDDDLIAGVGEPVEGAVAEDGIVEEAEPLLDGAVGGDDEAGDPMPIEDEVVEVGGLLCSEPMQPEVVQDEQIGREEGPEGAVDRVVHSGLCHGLAEVVGVDEADDASGADGGVAECLSEEALADAGGADEQDMFVLVQELQREDGVQQAAVHGDGRGPVEVLQSAGLLEASTVEPDLDTPVLTSADLVGEDDLQE